MTQFCSFLWLRNIPLYICATSSLSIHLSMYIRLIIFKEFPSNLGQAVGLVPSLKNMAAGSGTKGGLGTGNKLDCFCQLVKVSMVSWFWKDGCLWPPSLFGGMRCDQEWVLYPLKLPWVFLGPRTHLLSLFWWKQSHPKLGWAMDPPAGLVESSGT